MRKIISFGEVLVDLIGKKGKGIKNSFCFEKFFGGAPANYAVGCRRLGANVVFLTGISNDSFGDFLLGVLKKEKVNTSFIKKTSFKTALAFVALNKKGKPDFSFYRDNTADVNVTKNDINERVFKGAKIFHFCSLSLLTEPVRSALFFALRLAKKNELIISFDPNLRANLLKSDTLSWVKKALRYADVFLPSEEEALFISGKKNLDEAAKKLGKSYKIRKIIITRGEKGAILFEGNQKITFRGYKVKTVDTTGAGDSFSAGISVGILKKYESEKLLNFAGAAAAISVQKNGAISSLPTIKEVEKFLKDRDVNL